ncbi:MAG: hypothetical protein VR72_05730 [Clostridiaceae bacterium BRH_c20a]|nr:MAG: hypothetical protein VR72_05730 [Clostridiaceae bacterium BRH_c20a]
MGFSYPISLNITRKKCIVIGGGKIALRKINSLLEAGAVVFLISPKISDEIRRLVNENLIQWIEKEYNSELVNDSFLVIAATNIREVNQEIANFCHAANILVNVVDSPNDSSFIVNSYLKQGDLTLAISTNGKSPALSHKIREDLTVLFGPEYAVLLDLLAEVRGMAKKNIEDEVKRNKFFREIVRTDILQIIKEYGIEEARERVKKCLLSY